MPRIMLTPDGFSEERISFNDHIIEECTKAKSAALKDKEELRREADHFTGCLNELRSVLVEMDSINHKKVHDLVHEIAGMRENCYMRIAEAEHAIDRVDQVISAIKSGNFEVAASLIDGLEEYRDHFEPPSEFDDHI